MSPEDETRQRIIQGAAQVFAQKGYEGATTRAIAEAAGINEVTLFRHFGNKQGLFQAVIGRFSALPGLAAMEGQLTGDYREDLTAIGRHFLAMMHRNRRSILTAMLEVQRQPEIRKSVAQPPTRQRQMLGQYLRGQMACGVVRHLPDPELAAQMFFGMLFEYSVNQLLADPAAPQPADEDMIVQMVDIFVRGTINMEER
jgi:AcrR family transcriptional regulator